MRLRAGSFANARAGMAPISSPSRRIEPEVESRRRSEEHTSELQSRQYLVCRLLLEKKKKEVTIFTDTANKPGGFVSGMMLTNRVIVKEQWAHNVGNMMLRGWMVDDESKSDESITQR